MLHPKQREQLHAAIHGYLRDNFPDVAEHFLNVIGGLKPGTDHTNNSLESKWNTALRMQKKIFDLNKEIQDLKSKLSLFSAAHDYQHDRLSFPIEPAIFSLKGHRKAITKLIFHSIFQILISSSEDGTIKIWNYEQSRTIERSLNEHTDSINDIDIDTTGKWLASASSDLTIKIWDLTKYECIKTMTGHEAIISAVVFILNSEQILSASKDSSIKLWNIQTGFCLRTYLGHSDWVRSVAFPPFSDTRLFASCSNDKKIALWNLDESVQISTIVAHEHVIEKIIFAPKNTLELLCKNKLSPAPLPPYLRPRSTNEDGTDSFWDLCGFALVSISRDKEIKLWDVFTSQCLQTYIGHDNWVREVLFHPSGYYLLSCSDDCSIKIWDIITGICTKSILKSHNSFVRSIAFCPHNGILASGSMNSQIKIWECQKEIKENK